ncbi:SDR family NAD(P)-dependent oxidoreductase [Clostridium polynesiense]|uniref:SDR family NAD(P)-dependent oxidoreductase n=1 Tax=Clostridium polynesiense TaxID=1325933 RepID=UPI00059052C9|nr:SDR family oxidoreductase [Clostridium polynesiense]
MNYSLITGAASGIGLELSTLLAEDGNNLILIGRNEKRLLSLKSSLEKKYNISAYVITKDLSKENAPEEIYNEITSRGFVVENLINNAGFGSFGRFVEIDTHTDLSMIDTNCRALTHLIKLFLPDMLKRNKGRILNTASTAAFLPGPYMAVYYATKAYVLSLSEALASETSGTGVTVSVLCPGPTKTEFQSKAKMNKSGFVKLGFMDAHTVALHGYKGMLKGKKIIVPGALNKFLVSAIKLLPRSIVTRMAKSTQKL